MTGYLVDSSAYKTSKCSFLILLVAFKNWKIAPRYGLGARRVPHAPLFLHGVGTGEHGGHVPPPSPSC